MIKMIGSKDITHLATSDIDELMAKVIKLNHWEAVKFDSRILMDEYQIAQIREHIMGLLRDPEFGAVLVFKVDEKICGFISGIIEGSRAKILDVWVDEEHRGSTAATRLFYSLHDYFGKCGVTKIICETSVQNDQVHDMLVRFGYSPFAVTFMLNVEDE